MASKYFRKALERIPDETKVFVRTYAHILKRIDYLLQIKGYKQKDLAQRLDKRESEISKWLNGEHNLTLRTVAKLEVALGEPILKVLPVPEDYEEKVWKKTSVGHLNKYVAKPKQKPTNGFESAETSIEPASKIEVA